MDWKKIYNHLVDNGFEVYSLGQHEGKCKEPHIVLRNNGATRVRSVEAQEYETLLYCPYGQYSKFESYISSVKLCMNNLYPCVSLVDDQQPHYPDDDVKAYMTSLIYRVTKASEVNRIK